MRTNRALALSLGLLVVCAALVVLRQSGPGSLGIPDCLFHRGTGMDCPACGMTRATHELLHGRVAAAFRLNPLGIILAPVIAIWLAIRLPKWLRGSQGRSSPVRARLLFGSLAILVLAYWILRNLPWWPFSPAGPP